MRTAQFSTQFVANNKATIGAWACDEQSVSVMGIYRQLWPLGTGNPGQWVQWRCFNNRQVSLCMRWKYPRKPLRLERSPCNRMICNQRFLSTPWRAQLTGVYESVAESSMSIASHKFAGF